MSEPITTAATPRAVARAACPVTVEVRVRLLALAVTEPGGGYSVVVPALPGCVTQGDTIEEAQANIVEASEGWLAVAHERNRGEALRLVLE